MTPLALTDRGMKCKNFLQRVSYQVAIPGVFVQAFGAAEGASDVSQMSDNSLPSIVVPFGVVSQEIIDASFCGTFVSSFFLAGILTVGCDALFRRGRFGFRSHFRTLPVSSHRLQRELPDLLELLRRDRESYLISLRELCWTVVGIVKN